MSMSEKTQIDDTPQTSTQFFTDSSHAIDISSLTSIDETTHLLATVYRNEYTIDDDEPEFENEFFRYCVKCFELLSLYFVFMIAMIPLMLLAIWFSQLFWYYQIVIVALVVIYFYSYRKYRRQYED
ncbi:2680_t:CDS:1 [Acaulospora morrowiae]|uniref:2680_t:CDS:1 n=1 Tax=Acaulospora morrowiae TaxID=94023 RepID=A0A9N9I0V1_9GLOM|nr:2680_t:CDS:1 [Acaulospora morrowiae]